MSKFTGLEKTQMCKAIMTNRKCHKGKDCTYAHSVEELRPVICTYDENCYKFNDPECPCTFVHTGETRDDYIARTGEKWYADVVIPSAQAAEISKCHNAHRNEVSRVGKMMEVPPPAPVYKEALLKGKEEKKDEEVDELVEELQSMEIVVDTIVVLSTVIDVEFKVDQFPKFMNDLLAKKVGFVFNGQTFLAKMNPIQFAEFYPKLINENVSFRTTF